MATLTVKNVPEDLVRRLKTQAAAHRRSLNQEVITCLEQRVERTDPERLLAEIDAAREKLAARGVWVTPEEVDRWIDEGRE